MIGYSLHERTEKRAEWLERKEQPEYSAVAALLREWMAEPAKARRDLRQADQEADAYMAKVGYQGWKYDEAQDRLARVLEKHTPLEGESCCPSCNDECQGPCPTRVIVEAPVVQPW